MSKNLHHIDKLFKQALNEHSEDVPQMVWQNVEDHLVDKDEVSYKRKYYQLKRWAIALLIIGFLLGGYALYNNVMKPTQNNNVRTNVVSTTNDNQRNNLQVEETTKPRTTMVENTREHSGSDHVISKQNVPAQQKIFTPANDLRDRPYEKFIADKNQSTALKEKQNILPLDVTKNETSVNYRNLELLSSSVFIPSNPGNEFLSLRASVKKTISEDAISNVIQQVNKRLIKRPLFSLSAFAAPDVSFEELKDNDHYTGPARNREQAKRSEQDLRSFTAGLLLDYQFSSKWAIESGIQFSSYSSRTPSATMYAKTGANGAVGYEFNCSSGYSLLSPKTIVPQTGDSAVASGARTLLNYLSVPLVVKRILDVGKFTLTPSIGASGNFLVGDKVSATIEHGVEREKSDDNNITGLRSSYLSGMASIGAEYHFSRQLSVFVVPGVQIAVTPINKNTPVTSYTNYVSAATGVRIKL